MSKTVIIAAAQRQSRTGGSRPLLRFGNAQRLSLSHMARELKKGFPEKRNPPHPCRAGHDWLGLAMTAKDLRQRYPRFLGTNTDDRNGYGLHRCRGCARNPSKSRKSAPSVRRRGIRFPPCPPLPSARTRPAAIISPRWDVVFDRYVVANRARSKAGWYYQGNMGTPGRRPRKTCSNIQYRLCDPSCRSHHCYNTMSIILGDTGRRKKRTVLRRWLVGLMKSWWGILA